MQIRGWDYNWAWDYTRLTTVITIYDNTSAFLFAINLHWYVQEKLVLFKLKNTKAFTFLSPILGGGVVQFCIGCRVPGCSGSTTNFFVGGIEGAKCNSEGAKIQKFTKNGWFWPFFLLTEGKVGAEPPRGGGQIPHPPPPPLIPALPGCRCWFVDTKPNQISLPKVYLYFHLSHSVAFSHVLNVCLLVKPNLFCQFKTQAKRWYQFTSQAPNTNHTNSHHKKRAKNTHLVHCGFKSFCFPFLCKKLLKIG